jgi:hypothetical protein
MGGYVKIYGAIFLEVVVGRFGATFLRGCLAQPFLKVDINKRITAIVHKNVHP